MKNADRQRKGYVLIFRPYIRHPVTKEVIYPKRGKVFALWIKSGGKPGLN